MTASEVEGVPVAVVRTGTANLASVLAGLRRAGGAPTLVEDADAVREASHLVVPGVGALGAAMEALEAAGLVEALRARLRVGRATLGICLGMQLWFEGSAESPGVGALGVAPGRFERFAGGVRVPHFGWNRVAPGARAGWLTPGYAYFAHSYRLEEAAMAALEREGWSAAVTTHGGAFVSAVERGALLACQFHPELSGAWGHGLLRRWLSLEALGDGVELEGSC